CSLTAQQPMNNVVRTTLQALAAVLGGTQSLHTNSMDETLALPTEEAVKLALRTQQIIAHESEVTNTVDPLGGSSYVEPLTDRLASLRARRDSFKMAGTLEELQEAAAGDDNLMPYLLDAVKAEATLGEICAALKEVFGTYKEPVVL